LRKIFLQAAQKDLSGEARAFARIEARESKIEDRHFLSSIFYPQ
jgi:hypothetical protein